VGLNVNTTCSIVSIGGVNRWGSVGISGGQWGSRVLLMRPVAVGKELFLWREVLVLERWQIAAENLLSRANGTLQSALVLGSGSSVPDGDGGGEDGLNDGGVEVHHHCLWQVELL